MHEGRNSAPHPGAEEGGPRGAKVSVPTEVLASLPSPVALKMGWCPVPARGPSLWAMTAISHGYAAQRPPRSVAVQMRAEPVDTLPGPCLRRCTDGVCEQDPEVLQDSGHQPRNGEEHPRRKKTMIWPVSLPPCQGLPHFAWFNPPNSSPWWLSFQMKKW